MLQAEDLALDRGDIGTSVQPGEIVTIMFTDIEGFAALTERLGDWQAQQILHAHAALVREQIRSYGGFEVNTLGDGFMVAFPSARRALRCAVAVQRAVDTHSRRHPGEQIRVRIGLHTGEAIRDGNDFCGKTVIIAARVTDEAEGGEILVSAALKRTVESPGEFLFDDERVVELKGLAGPYPLFGVPWAMDGSVRPAPRRVLADGNVFCREGDYWTLAYLGTVIRLRDAKGLHDIAQLLREPNRAFPALYLVAGVSPDGSGSGVGAGPLLDPKAKAAYQQRLADLREELEEAERFNDLARSAKLHAEIEALTAQLLAAVGLDGRDRVVKSNAERARVAVTIRIKRTLARIGEVHPGLGHHLATTIRTGRLCVYQPDPTLPVSWSFVGARNGAPEGRSR